MSPAAGVDYRQKLWSAGGEIEAPLGSTHIVGGGLVFDKTTTPETGGRTPAQEPFDNVGWRAGATHELSGAVRLHASVSQRSRFPALRELYSGALNRFLPNPGPQAGNAARLRGRHHDEQLARAKARRRRCKSPASSHDLDDAVVRITLPAPDRGSCA